MVELLYIVAAGLYGLNAGLGLLIVATARRGPDYWPALSLVALGSGIPGVYFLVLRILRWFDVVGRDPDVPTIFTLCLVFLLCCGLQGQSVRRVRTENRKYFDRNERRRRLRRALQREGC